MVQTRSLERAGHEVLEHVTENLRNVSLAEVPQDVAGFLTLLLNMYGGFNEVILLVVLFQIWNGEPFLVIGLVFVRLLVYVQVSPSRLDSCQSHNPINLIPHSNLPGGPPLRNSPNLARGSSLW